MIPNRIQEAHVLLLLPSACLVFFEYLCSPVQQPEMGKESAKPIPRTKDSRVVNDNELSLHATFHFTDANQLVNASLQKYQTYLPQMRKVDNDIQFNSKNFHLPNFLNSKTTPRRS